MPIEFEWDLNKAESNLRKHGVAFEDAIRAFSDPYSFTELERHVDGEERWQMLGFANQYVLLLVVHTSRDIDGFEIVRIISARNATNIERKRYEKNYYGSI